MQRIHVVDANGNVFADTYPKRARGLIKKGRARLIRDDTICLTRPPDIHREGQIMNEAKTIHSAEIFAELQKIREDTSYLAHALEKLEKAPTDGDAQACVRKIDAIEQIVAQREETNRALIHAYRAMLGDEADDETVDDDETIQEAIADEDGTQTE